MAASFLRYALLLGTGWCSGPGNSSRLGSRDFEFARRAGAGPRRGSGYAQAAIPVGRSEPGTGAAALRRDLEWIARRLLGQLLSGRRARPPACGRDGGVAALEPGVLAAAGGADPVGRRRRELLGEQFRASRAQPARVPAARLPDRRSGADRAPGEPRDARMAESSFHHPPPF